MKRIQRKRTTGWKMPANTNKIISKERQTYTLCRGHKDEKKNTIVSHVEDTHTESHCPVVPNKNISNIIGQDATGITPIDGKEGLKRENKERHTATRNPKQETQEQNEVMQFSKPTYSKDLENNARDVASQIKEHSKSTISMAVATKSANNLDGNTSKCSRAFQTKNSKVSIEHSARIATKSNAIPVRVQRKRTKGFKLQDASPNGLPVVYVGRPTKWGNPYAVEPRGQFTREEAIRAYENYVKSILVGTPHFLDELKGKDLACWCPLDKRCHADVLLKLMESNKGGSNLKLRLSSDFFIDTDDYKREGLRFSILAMSGHGKSNAAADIVEDVLDNHGQVIIIEPIPEWHTLKARYNNVVVVGGPYQDLPLEPAFAHEYVRAALEKGISLVVNVSDIEDEGEQIKFVSSFLWNLYRLEQKHRRVLFLVLEEADTWAPQMWDQVTKQSLSRVSLIAKHGRKIGIFPILISQRPADLHKSPLSQCNINLFGKFTSPADLDPKTGLMFLVKKQHLNISEEQIMKLPTGSFVVSHKGGVDTVAVRKRLCLHGADTPLIEPKPFTADLSRALGGLQEEIAKAVAAKKEEESTVKRLEKQVQDLKKLNEQLQEKANIKLSVKEMMEAGARPQVPGFELPRGPDMKKLEGHVVFLESVKKDLEKRLNENGEELKLYDELKSVFRQMFQKGIGPHPFLQKDADPAVVGLQRTVTVVDVASAEKLVCINTENMRGKILSIAKKGKLDTWRRLDDIVKAVEEEHWSATPQEVNNALNDLEKQDFVAKKHTDRNYYCLAQGVKFERVDRTLPGAADSQEVFS